MPPSFFLFGVGPEQTMKPMQPYRVPDIDLVRETKSAGRRPEHMDSLAALLDALLGRMQFDGNGCQKPFRWNATEGRRLCGARFHDSFMSALKESGVLRLVSEYRAGGTSRRYTLHIPKEVRIKRYEPQSKRGQQRWRENGSLAPRRVRRVYS